MKISRFFFGGSKYSSYFCQRLKDDSKLSGRATVIAYGFLPQAFFMPKNIFPTGEFYFPNWENEYGGCMNRKI